MWLKFISILICFGVAFSLEGEDAPPVVITPKLSAFQESVRSKTRAESKVTITVGEKNGFAYTVNGLTNSIHKISVSGEYFNDEAAGYGYARLFLVVDTGVGYYSLRPRGSALDVYVENYYYDEFYFEILCPSPVTAYDLHEGQINATAVLITGPSRSAVRYPRLKSISDVDNGHVDVEHVGNSAIVQDPVARRRRRRSVD